MTLFLRFLRLWADYDIWFANYRMDKLVDMLNHHEIDIEIYIVLRNDLACQKLKAQNDFERWDGAIHSYSINGG